MTNLIIIFAAKYLFVCSVLVFLYYGYTTRDKTKFIRFVVLCGVLAFFLSRLASVLYYNPRPFMLTGIPPLVAHGPGNGFPSDHSLLTGTIAAIVTVFNPYLGAFLWLVALVVGVGRVFADVHHYVDVFTSFAIAAVSVLSVRYFLRARPDQESNQS